MSTRLFEKNNKAYYKGGLSVINLGKELKKDLNALTVLPCEIPEDTIGVASVSLYYYAILENDIRCFEGYLETTTIRNIVEDKEKKVTVSSDLKEIKPSEYFVRDVMIPKLLKTEREDKEKLIKICEEFIKRGK